MGVMVEVDGDLVLQQENCVLYLPYQHSEGTPRRHGRWASLRADSASAQSRPHFVPRFHRGIVMDLSAPEGFASDCSLLVSILRPVVGAFRSYDGVYESPMRRHGAPFRGFLVLHMRSGPSPSCWFYVS